MSKVLVLMGSPRKNGNTKLLCDEFIRGAQEAGHEVDYVAVQGMKVAGCLGCGACMANGGECIQKDDMQDIIAKVDAADHIVLASPVYYYTWTAKLKAVLDRFYCRLLTLGGKTFHLISSCASATPEYTEMMVQSFRCFYPCFYGEGNKEGGIVIGYGTQKPGDINGSPAMQEAYEMGKNL